VLSGGWISEDVTRYVARGLEPPRVTVEPGETATLDIRIVPAARLEGSVLDETGTPVAGIAVEAVPPDDWGGYPTRLTARTAADGAYRLDDLVPGFPYEVVPRPVDRFPARSGPVRGASGETVRLDVRLLPSRSLRVRVVDETTREPVPGASVRVMSERMRDFREDLGEWWTDRDGRVEVGPLPDGPLPLHVRWDVVAPVEVRVPGEAEDEEILVTVATELVIGGRIVVTGDPSSPIRGVRLIVTPPSRERETTIRSSVRPDGTFRLGVPYRGDYVLRAVGGERTLGEWTVEAGREDLVLEIDAPPPAPVHRDPPVRLVTFRVLGPDGQPVDTCRLRTAMDASRGSYGGKTVHGEARIAVRGERVWLEVVHARSSSGAALGPGEFGPFDVAQETITVRLPPGRTIEGTVLGPGGEPVEGAVIRAFAVLLGSRRGPPERDVARSGSEGRFRLDGLGEGLHRLRIEAPPGFTASAAPISAKAGETDVLVRLSRARTYTIRVLDPDGKPVAGAQVSATASTVTTDVEGVARLELDGKPVRYMSIRPPGERDDLAELSVLDWPPEDGDIRLLGSITGRVVDPSGRGVEGALVWYRTLEGRWFGAGEPTGPGGSFLARHVVAPVVPLRVTVQGARPESAEDTEARVAAGTRDAVLRFDPGLDLTVRVTNARAGWHAELVPESPGTASLLVYPKRIDRYEFHGLRAGIRYTFRLAGAGGDAVVETGIPGDAGAVDVEVAPGKTVRGRFEVPEGATGISVKATSGRMWVRGEVDPDGSFEIRGLFAGAWTVTATALTGESRWEGTCEVQAGAEAEIELVATPR
jgi:protocatechuate 3,4-dioxygenase beta subunit